MRLLVVLRVRSSLSQAGRHAGPHSKGGFELSPVFRTVPNRKGNEVSWTSVKSLIRRVEVVERAARKAAPQNRNLLVEMSNTAMAGAWTPHEVEEMLAAAERSQLDQLPADLRRRWVRYLDGLSLQRFGKTFGALLASPPANTRMPAGMKTSPAALIESRSIERKEMI